MTTLRDSAAGDLPAVDTRLLWETSLYLVALVATTSLGLVTASSLIQFASKPGSEGPVYALAVITFLALSLQVGRWIVLLILAMWENIMCHGCRPGASQPAVGRRRPPRISVLMPAYNEEETVDKALRSMRELDYPDVEVVFVDDGSTDGTLAIARKFEGRRQGVEIRVHTKANGGKWSALNHALRHSTGELVLFVDADSHLDPGALRHLHRALEARSAAAVAGYVRVRNRGSVLTWLQSLEYLSCNGTMRAAQSSSGTVLVVAGPIGLYRRAILQRVFDKYGTKSPASEMGPMAGDTFAEDFDLSLAVLTLGERIVYEPRAVAYTKAPATMSGLLNQRYRWIRGSLQVLRKLAVRARREPEVLTPAMLCWLAMSYLMDYALMPLLGLVGLLFLVVTVAGHGLPGSTLLSVLGLLAISQLAMALCFASTHDEQKRLAAVLPLRGLYSGFFLMSILPFVFWDELRRSPMRW